MTQIMLRKLGLNENSCKMTGLESREAWKADTGGKIFKAAAEGKVQAMQLKLFIEISVL